MAVPAERVELGMAHAGTRRRVQCGVRCGGLPGAGGTQHVHRAGEERGGARVGGMPGAHQNDVEALRLQEEGGSQARRAGADDGNLVALRCLVLVHGPSPDRLSPWGLLRC